jgi:hypothetical protein
MTERDSKIVQCGTHGARIGAIVCRHLIEAKDIAVGFVEDESDPDDLMAWCDDCESLFLEEGDYTERFEKFCDARIVCDFCYANIKERHRALGGNR